MRKLIRVESTKIVKDQTMTSKVEDNDFIAEDRIHAQ